MNARLVAISGPLEGATFPIEGELSIGRDRQNTLAIEDRVLSRRHCTIQATDGKCSLRDLGSSNGTYVNGLPVTMRMLNDGDQITAGQSLFLFACGAAARAGSGAVEIDRGGLNPMSTLMLKPEDAIYLRPEEVPEIPGAGKNLRVLLAIGSAISSIRGLEALEQRLLESIFDVIPAERGAILLPGAQSGRIRFCMLLEPGGSEPVHARIACHRRAGDARGRRGALQYRSRRHRHRADGEPVECADQRAGGRAPDRVQESAGCDLSGFAAIAARASKRTTCSC